MADTLSRIAGPSNIPSGTNTLFTGLANHVYTIKKILIVNNTGSARTIKLGINVSTDDHLILPTVSIDAGGWAEFDGMEVLTGAETIQAVADGTGMTFSMAGLDQG